MHKIILLMIAVLLIWPVQAKAEAGVEVKAEAEVKVEDDKKGLCKALDRRYRLSKRLQNELGFFGGGYLGDETHNSWVVGGRYFLHLNNTFALGASYSYTPVITDWSSTFGQSLRTKQQHLIDAELMISNDAAFRSGNTIVELDLYFTLGIGVIRINQQNMPLGIVGGGAKFYTGVPWLTVRFDVNSYIHPTPNPNGDTLNSDMSILAGVSFLFPQRKPPEED